MRNDISQQLNKHSGLLTNISNAQLGLRDLLYSESLREQSQTNQTPSGNSLSCPIIGIGVRSHRHYYSPCTKYCRCNCHEQRTFMSPRPIRSIIGALFTGYSGYPLKTFRQCNKSNCQGQQMFRAYIHYFFPLWLLKKAFTINLLASFSGEIQVSLKIARIVSSGAEIFRVTQLNDVSGLQQLFKQGLASPNDVTLNGLTVLQVCLPFLR